MIVAEEARVASFEMSGLYSRDFTWLGPWTLAIPFRPARLGRPRWSWLGPRCHATRQGCRGPGQSSSTQRLAQRPGGSIVQYHLNHSINYSCGHKFILYCRLFTFKDYCRKVFHQPRSGGQVLLRLFFSSSFCFGVTFCFCFLQWPCFSVFPEEIYIKRDF